MDPQDSNQQAYSTNSNTTLVSSDDFTSLSSSNDQYFSIEVECKVFYSLNGVIVDGATDTIECGITIVPTQDIEPFIYMIFSYFDVPDNAQARMAAKILGYAEEIMNEAPKNQQILDMYIVLAHTSQIPHYNDDDDNIDDYYGAVVEESMNVNGNMRIIPASESSIEGLEKVNFKQIKEGNNTKEKCNCAICLEDFSVDSEAVRMPCFHLFHKTCITGWLHIQNTCPLCRFEMPIEDDE